MQSVIMVVGFKGSGKDTLADYFVDKGYTKISFADALKDTVCAAFSWDREMMEGATPESREWREQVDVWWAKNLGIPHFTPRWAMCEIGSDVLRKHFHDALWRLSVQRRIESEPTTNFVIADGRFREEIRMVENLGGTVVRVKRGPEPEYWDLALKANAGDGEAISELADIAHQSEWDWIGTDFSHEFENNGTIDDLFTKAETMLKGQI